MTAAVDPVSRFIAEFEWNRPAAYGQLALRLLLPTLRLPFFRSLGSAVIRAALPAVTLTMGLFLVGNMFLSAAVERQYLSLRLPVLRDCPDAKSATARCIELGWADQRLRGWLEQALVVNPAQRLSSEQLLDVFDHVGIVQNQERSRRQETLHRLLTGSRTEWLWGACGVSVTAPPPQAIYEALSGGTTSGFSKMLAKDSDRLGDLKRKFLERYIAAMSVEMAEPIREVRRWNGSVQWATVLVAWLITWLGLQRGWLARTLDRTWLPHLTGELAASPSEEVQPPASPQKHELAALSGRLRTMKESGRDAAEIRETLDRELRVLRESIEEEIYGTLHFLLGVLPALGFIGTIMGMGSALLAADGLFSSANPQHAVADITQQLGFAFDTTLVALLAGIVTGIWLAAVRLYERRFLQQAEIVLVQIFIEASGHTLPLATRLT